MSRDDSDIDDDFSELYKEYTGPPRPNTTSVPETTKTSKRSHADSDEDEDETLDPNAVPTDFTSRDAKVWEAKSKATERNWKKRKEEEMICKLCGDSSHYTQGCPSTLGASRKSQDLFQRVPARDPQVKALFTDRVVKEIEKDIGCKIKIEEKFIIVSGKDGQTLSKGVDAVHKIKDEGIRSSESDFNVGESNSRSPKGKAPVASRLGSTDSQRSNLSPRNPSNHDQRSNPSPRNPSNHEQRANLSSRNPSNYDQRSYPSPRNPSNHDQRSNPGSRNPSNYDQRSYPSPRNPSSHDQRSNPSPRNPSNYDQRSGRPDKVITEHAREEFQKHRGRSPQARAFGNDGIQSRSTHSKSPGRRPQYSGGSYDLNDNHKYERGPNLQSSHKDVYSTLPLTLEELELKFKREAMDIAKIRDKEEDEENYRHHEAIKEIRETYMKRLATMREMHAKQWEEFHQREARKRQQETRLQMANVGFGGYNHYDYGAGGGGGVGVGGGNPYINNMQIESRVRYPDMDNYPPLRSNNDYYDFQRQRAEDYGEAYNRY